MTTDQTGQQPADDTATSQEEEPVVATIHELKPKTTSKKPKADPNTGPDPKSKSMTAKDLAQLLKVEPTIARRELRRIAKTDSSPLFRVKEGSGYQWTPKELEAVAKKVAKSLDDQKAQESTASK